MKALFKATAPENITEFILSEFDKAKEENKKA